MSSETHSQDLIVLAADKHISACLETLLQERRTHLAIRAVSFDIHRHPHSDPGCRTSAAEFLRPFINRYRYALVVFDHRGCGSDQPPDVVQREVEDQLERNGWQDSRAIAIAPELESWIWSPSREIARVLGWGHRFRPLQDWLRQQNLWPAGLAKPPEPKKAVEQAIRQKKKVRSSALFKELAAVSTFDGCTDPAFGELRRTLQTLVPCGQHITDLTTRSKKTSALGVGTQAPRLPPA